jgi:small subunit ribosomal protein S18
MSEEKFARPEATEHKTHAAPYAASGERGARPFGPKKRFEARRKVCKFCAEHIDRLDYKNIQLVKTFTMESGKILSRRITGTCAKHQRQVTQAVKRDRNLAFLPYSLPKR